MHVLLPWRAQVQGYDRFLWNGTHYTVDRFVQDLKTRYGGADAIFLWPTYENLGLDDRNQLQMFKAMPGGYDALRELHHQLYAEGVRVIWGHTLGSEIYSVCVH